MSCSEGDLEWRGLINCCEVTYDGVSLYFQCRKYKGSDQVKKKSEFIYNKFKAMFLIGESENFAMVSGRAHVFVSRS